VNVKREMKEEENSASKRGGNSKCKI